MRGVAGSRAGLIFGTATIVAGQKVRFTPILVSCSDYRAKFKLLPVLGGGFNLHEETLVKSVDVKLKKCQIRSCVCRAF